MLGWGNVLLLGLGLSCATRADSNPFWSNPTDGFWNIAGVLAPATRPAQENLGRWEEGKASWYGGQFLGRKTSSGQRLTATELTAAHRNLPLGTLVEVYVPSTDRKIIVRINDRGPVSHKRLIDLSFAAARTLGIVQKGIAEVKIRVIQQTELGPLTNSGQAVCATTESASLLNVLSPQAAESTKNTATAASTRAASTAPAPDNQKSEI